MSSDSYRYACINLSIAVCTSCNTPTRNAKTKEAKKKQTKHKETSKAICLSVYPSLSNFCLFIFISVLSFHVHFILSIIFFFARLSVSLMHIKEPFLHLEESRTRIRLPHASVLSVDIEIFNSIVKFRKRPANKTFLYSKQIHLIFIIIFQ